MSQHLLNIQFGYEDDEIEMLQELSRIEAEELLQIIDVPDNESIEIPFCTQDMCPEIICIAIFKRNDKGEKFYELDFSQGTL